MKCEFWKQEISAMLDGALDAREKARVDRHLSGCDECRDFFEHHSRLTRFIRNSALAVDPPEILWQKIENKIAVQSPQTERPSALEPILAWLRVPNVAYGLAAALLLAFTGLVAIRTQDSSLMESRDIAALEAYTIDVSGNPFLSDKVPENPFFDLDEREPANPFRSGEFPK